MLHTTRIDTIRRTVFFIALLSAPLCVAGQWTGNITGELRLFPAAPLYPEQHGHNLSLSFQPEYHHEWPDSGTHLVFSPFLRLDQHDNRRTHADLRELYWHKITPGWELRVGFQKVFWGVTESRNLVDVINQKDGVEGIASDAKLGQPMVNFTWLQDWGTLDVYLMPYFRERTFSGRHGRFRTPIPIDNHETRYESGMREWHPDVALRYTHYFGNLDVGLSHFAGTSRDPRYLARVLGRTFSSDSVWANLTGSTINSPLFKLIQRIPDTRLIPYYDQIHQTGLDMQYLLGSWVLKLEAIHRSGQERTFTAATAGVEYTFYSVLKSPLDVTAIVEYMWDSRGRQALTPFANDIFLGSRVSFNDVAGTLVQGGLIVDANNGAMALGLEASRRLGENWRVKLESGLFANVSPDDILTTVRKDDYIQAEVTWFF